MFVFLVQLSDRSPPKPGLNPDPPLSAKVQALQKFAPCLQNIKSDADKNAAMDEICGKGIVPTAQWYYVGYNLDEATRLILKQKFFGRIPIQQRQVGIRIRNNEFWIRVELAFVRVLSITINGRICPLQRIEHRFDNDEVVTLDFPFQKPTSEASSA